MKGDKEMVFKPCYAENGAIIQDDGARVTFHPVCPKCGKVMQNVTGTGYCSNGSALAGSYTCYNGCPMFYVTLHRG